MKSKNFILFLIIGLLVLSLSASPSISKEVGGSIKALTFSPDSKLLAVAATEANGRLTLKLWNISTQQLVSTVHIRDASFLTFSPDGKFLAVGGYDGCNIWQVASQRSIDALNGYTSDATFSPDGKLLARALGFLPSAIQVWDLRSQQELIYLSNQGKNLSTNLAFSTDGKYLAAGSGNWGTISIWNLEKSQALRALTPAGAVRSIAFSPGGKFLASGGSMPTAHGVSLWDLETQTEVAKLEGYTNAVRFVVFSSDGRTLVSAEDNLAIIWDVERKKQIASLSSHPQLPPRLRHHSSPTLLPMALSPDGQWLANPSIGEKALDDDQIFLWRMPNHFDSSVSLRSGLKPIGKLTLLWGRIKK